MTQINELVNKFIKKDVIVQRALENDFVSLRKLGRYIAKKLELDSSRVDAIISAVRRFDVGTELLDYREARGVIKNTKISTKSDVVSVAIEKFDGLYDVLAELFKRINFSKGEALRIIQADESIKVVVDKKNFNKVCEMIADKHIIRVENDLAEINLHLDDVAVRTRGIISGIFSELVIHDVNVVETLSCVPELILFVKEDDLLKSYSVLFNLIKKR